jgi:hypothetical protein
MALAIFFAQLSPATIPAVSRKQLTPSSPSADLIAPPSLRLHARTK